MSITWDTAELTALAVDLAGAPARGTVLAGDEVADAAERVRTIGTMLAPRLTGELAASIGADVAGLEAEIGPTAEHGLYQEEGTSKMAPNPFMGPALSAVEPTFVAGLEDAAEQAVFG